MSYKSGHKTIKAARLELANDAHLGNELSNKCFFRA